MPTEPTHLTAEELEIRNLRSGGYDNLADAKEEILVLRTQLEAARRELALLNDALELADMDFNHLRGIDAVGLGPLNNLGRWLGQARGDHPLSFDFKGTKAYHYRNSAPPAQQEGQ